MNESIRISPLMIIAGAGVAVGLGYIISKTFLTPDSSLVQLPMASIEVMERKVALKEVYSNMEENFKRQNLNLDFISKNGRNYEEVDNAKQRGTEMRALPYELPNACRLIVFPMDYDLELAQKLFQAAFKIITLLPENIKVYQNPAEILHVTIFHTSRPESIVIEDKEGKSEEYLDSEKDKTRSISESSGKPTLIFDRIILAESGVLLALWVDETEVCFDLRRQFKMEFPDAPVKQTNIIHTSLFRIITPSKLEQQVQEKVYEACQKYNEELSGTIWTPTHTRYTREHYFSTIQGQCFDFELS